MSSPHGDQALIAALGEGNKFDDQVDEAVESAVDALEATDTSHAAAATGVHGAGGSTLATAATLATAVSDHSAAATGVHGAGGSTLATAATLAAHAALAQAPAVHGQVRMDVVAGGNAESVLAAIAATDTIIGALLWDAAGPSLDAKTVAAAAGKVTYTGDETGKTIIVVWLDKTA